MHRRVKVAPDAGQIQSRRVCTVTSAFAYTPARPQRVTRSRVKVTSNSRQARPRRVRHSNISVRVYIHQRDHSGWCVIRSESHQAPGQNVAQTVDTATSALIYTPAKPQLVVRHRIGVTTNSSQIRSKRVVTATSALLYAPARPRRVGASPGQSHANLGQIRSKRVGTVASALMYTPARPQRVVRRRIRRSGGKFHASVLRRGGYQFLYVLFTPPRYAYSRSRPAVGSSGGGGVRVILHAGSASDHSGYLHREAVLYANVLGAGAPGRGGGASPWFVITFHLGAWASSREVQSALVPARTSLGCCAHTHTHSRTTGSPHAYLPCTLS